MFYPIKNAPLSNAVGNCERLITALFSFSGFSLKKSPENLYMWVVGQYVWLSQRGGGVPKGRILYRWVTGQRFCTIIGQTTCCVFLVAIVYLPLITPNDPMRPRHFPPFQASYGLRGRWQAKGLRARSPCAVPCALFQFPPQQDRLWQGSC